MSSGTRVEVDWAGADAAQADTPVPLSGAASGARAAQLTDEQILGLEPVSSGGSTYPSVLPSAARNPSSINNGSGEQPQRDPSGEIRPRNDSLEATPARTGASGAVDTNTAQTEVRATEMPAWMAAAAADPQHGLEAQALWREHQEFRAAFASPEEARVMKELLPGGARDVLSLREVSQSVERIDAALFFGDARAQAEVVAEIARANPAAFRSLFAEAAKFLADMREGAKEAGGREAGGSRLEARNPTGKIELNSSARASDLNAFTADHQSADSRLQPSASNFQNFDPTAYAAFERATNEAVARDVRGSISSTLERVLPEGVAEGAERRIGEDIFQEVQRALAADHALSEQVAGVLRERRFGSAEQERVAALLAGRARQLVPSVARRVIGEWTSTVLSTARHKAARQAAAASRVDIAAPGGSLDSMPLRQMSARQLDYASMSDEQILGM
jgi:hypothetical protein